MRGVFFLLLGHCFSLCFKELVSEAQTALSKFVQNWLQDQKFQRERGLRNNMTVYSSFPSDLVLKQSLLAESCNTMKADEIKIMYSYDLHTFLLSKQHYCTLAISRALTS